MPTNLRPTKRDFKIQAVAILAWLGALALLIMFQALAIHLGWQ
jgi:hypothetical protein